MKVKELQAVLAKMEPDAEFDNCKMFQDIAKEIYVRDFKSTLECLGYDTSKTNSERLTNMETELRCRLMRNDEYNQIYCAIVSGIAEENGLEGE